MSIVETFTALFNSIYISPNQARDLIIILSRYFPENARQTEITPYRSLSTLPQINVSSETCNNVDDAFKRAILSAKTSNIAIHELTIFIEDLTNVFIEIEQFGKFLSLKSLQRIFSEDKSLAGILEISQLIGFHLDIKIVSLNGSGFIVPSHISKREIEQLISGAKRLATHYGSVYPYRRLVSMPEWEFILFEHRRRFAKELLCEIEGFHELGNSEYYGFSNIPRDRILSRLLKIFSIYEEIPAGVLVKTLFKTLKSKVDDKDILEECSDVYDEYCILVGYCLEKERNLFVASQTLQVLIKQESTKVESNMLTIEKKLVSILRENGAPMDTANFVPVMIKNGANLSYLMEFATLIRREGWHKNSTYHTLDDYYGEVPSYKQEHKILDRRLVEISMIERDSGLSRKIKRLCENKCQICGKRIQIGEEDFYSEVHHIQPLGQPHNGEDKQENMICVCPNDHVILEYGVNLLDKSKILFMEKNPIGARYIDYHNKFIYHG